MTKQSPTWDPAEIVRREATRIAADASAPPELRAAARDHLLAPTIDDLDAALATMSFEQLSALAALDGELDEVAGDLGLAERRQAAWSRAVRAEVDAQRFAAEVATLDQELREQTGRATPPPESVTLAAADDSAAPEPVIAEAPISAPRDAAGWREYAKACLAKHRAAEEERSRQRTAELEAKRAAAREKIARDEERERRRRGEID